MIRARTRLRKSYVSLLEALDAGGSHGQEIRAAFQNNLERQSSYLRRSAELRDRKWWDSGGSWSRIEPGPVTVAAHCLSLHAVAMQHGSVVGAGAKPQPLQVIRDDHGRPRGFSLAVFTPLLFIAILVRRLHAVSNKRCPINSPFVGPCGHANNPPPTWVTNWFIMSSFDILSKILTNPVRGSRW